jgi:hypothetical protein
VVVASYGSQQAVPESKRNPDLFQWLIFSLTIWKTLSEKRRQQRNKSCISPGYPFHPCAIPKTYKPCAGSKAAIEELVNPRD